MMSSSRRFRAVIVSAVALALASAASLPLSSQDLSFYEAGARAASLGGSFTARADDITAIFYNPAGLAFLNGLRFKTNLAFGSRTMNATRSDNGWTYPNGPSEFRGDHYAAWQPARHVGLGLALYSPYSFSSRWPRSWGLESLAITSKLNAQVLRSAVAVEPLKGLAVSAAFDLVFLSVGWDHTLSFDLPNYPLEEPAQISSFQDLKGTGTGFAASALWKVFPWLQVGARYQSRVAVDLHGFNSFMLPIDSSAMLVPAPDQDYRLLAEVLSWFYADQRVTGRLNLPREIACGILVTPLRRLSLSFDLRWDRWSEFGRWEFTSVNMGGDLSPRFPATYREFYGIEPNYGVQGFDLVLADSRNIMAGLEYKLGKWFAVRAGCARLGSAVEEAARTPLYPDPGFTIYSLGVGYEGPMYAIWNSEEPVSRLSLDLFVRYAVSKAASSAQAAFDLSYEANRFVAGIGVGFIF